MKHSKAGLQTSSHSQNSSFHLLGLQGLQQTPDSCSALGVWTSQIPGFELDVPGLFISHKIQYQNGFKRAEATCLLNRKLVDCQCQFLTNWGWFIWTFRCQKSAHCWTCKDWGCSEKDTLVLCQIKLLLALRHYSMLHGRGTIELRIIGTNSCTLDLSGLIPCKLQHSLSLSTKLRRKYHRAEDHCHKCQSWGECQTFSSSS